MTEQVKPNIKLKKLLEILQGCYDRHKDDPECADNIEVEFWQGEKMIGLERIGQFGVKPDVTITLVDHQSAGEASEAVSAADGPQPERDMEAGR